MITLRSDHFLLFRLKLNSLVVKDKSQSLKSTPFGVESSAMAIPY